jgi:hypothetical protein
VDAPGELAQLVEARLQLRAGLVEDRRDLPLVGGLHAREAKFDRQGHEAGLGAVV